MNSVSSLFAQNSTYESSIQQILQLEGLKKAQLQVEQNELENQKTALSDIDSKLSAFNTLLTSFKESSAEMLKPLTGTSSDSESVNIVSTAGLNDPGNYAVNVTQVAKEDIMLSDALAQEGTDLNTNGSGSFEISLGSGDPVTINVDTTGLTNQEVMEAVATEINDKLGDQVKASVFKLGDGTSKLSFKSAETGKENRINITNQQGDLGSLLFSSVYAEDQLNAKFSMDGVSFERSSNLIDDVVDGFSFEINKTTNSAVELSVTRDTAEAKANIESFIKKFNAVNDTIRAKTFINGETGARGPLQRERSVRNLSFNLRQTLALPVSSLAGSTTYNSLNSIGIELKQDGTMEIKDSSVLEEALASDPEGVTNLFSADDGIAANLQQNIELYTKDSGGIFDSIQDGIERKIERIDNRIQAEERFLIQKEEQLRREFAELDQIINQGQSQFNQILSFQGQFGF